MTDRHRRVQSQTKNDYKLPAVERLDNQNIIGLTYKTFDKTYEIDIMIEKLPETKI